MRMRRLTEIRMAAKPRRGAPMRRIRALLITIPIALAGLVGVPSGAAAASADCFDPAASVTVEEQRLDLPVPQEILRITGYDRFARVFGAVLCATPNARLAAGVVAVQGRLLWTAAVERAQGRAPAPGLD